MKTTEPSNPAIQNQATKKGWINCFYKTYKGKKLGPYHVRRWKQHGRLYKEYIKPQDLERVKAECQAHKERKKKGSEISRWLNNTIGNLNYVDRMAKWAEQGRLRPEDKAFLTRIEQEGFAIDGRPKIRQNTFFCRVNISGKDFTIKHVLEPNGAIQTSITPIRPRRFLSSRASALPDEGFMVPSVANHQISPVSVIPDKREGALSGGDPRSPIRDFVVPFRANRFTKSAQAFSDWLIKTGEDAWNAVHNPQVASPSRR